MELVEALDANGIEYKQGTEEGEIRLCCPFCEEEGETPDTRFRLGVNVSTGKMHCFNCEKSSGDAGHTFRILEEKLELGELEAAVNRRPKKKKPALVELPEDFTLVKKVPVSTDYWGAKAYAYARRRNLTRVQMENKKVGFSTAGDYAFRIIFPMYYKGKLRGLVSRDFTDKSKLKYKNSEGDKGLYNAPDEPCKQKTAVLSEGVFDALSIERGVRCSQTEHKGRYTVYADSMGVLGHSLTEKQKKQLREYNEIILWPDPDEAGIKGFIAIAKELAPEKKSVHMVMPKAVDKEDYDPSDLFPSEVKDRLRAAKPFTPELEDTLRNWLYMRSLE